MNDIAAYVWGMLFGRTQLIKLSPKKTVEGFVGAAFTTVVFAYVVSKRVLHRQGDEVPVLTLRFFKVGNNFHAIQLHDLPSYRSRHNSLLQRGLPAERCLQLALFRATE